MKHCGITGAEEQFYNSPVREIISDADVDTNAKGGVVHGPIAVKTINNKDGIGKGKDQYTLHLGNGSKFPPKNQWVSFEDMLATP